jgi:uncharacterized protein (TIGR03067 family)
MKRFCLWAGAVLALGAASAADPMPLTLRFGKGDLDKVPAGWKVDKTGKGDGSVWKVVADETAPSKTGFVLAQTAVSPNAMFNLCVSDKPELKDLEAKVAFKAVKGENDQGGGLVWRYQDANNYYICRCNPLENNFRVYKVVDGLRQQLATTQDEVMAKTGEWHTLSIKQVGNQIECSLDGKKLLEAKDDTFTKAGKVGLWTKADAQTYFDDLHVVPLTSTAKEDTKEIEGTWVAVDAEQSGQKLPENVFKTIQLVLTADSYTVTVAGRLDKGTIKLMPNETPKAMDITGVEGPNKDKTILAIYELSGDTLKVCYALEGQKRPTELKSTPENKYFLVQYKRERP